MSTKIQTPLVPVSWGELIDKLTILDIKGEVFQDTAKKANVEHEQRALTVIAQQVLHEEEVLSARDDLHRVNKALWAVEDDIRDCERQKRFDDRFIELARRVYHLNDERAAIKRRINIILKSELVEEKGYAAY